MTGFEDGRPAERGVEGVRETPSASAGLARFFRQRQELGVRTIVFEEVLREEALATTREARVRDARSQDAGPQDARRQGTRDQAARGRGAPAPAATADATQRDGAQTDADPAYAPVYSPDPNPGPALGRKESETDDPPQDGEAFEESLPTLHDDLRSVALGCTRCRLSEGRTQVVFSDGHPEARLMVVGEAPGANEDRTGVPFVGAAGQLLDLLLASVDLSRETSVYICNVIKCRPPGNRNPRPDEIRSCAPYLRRQIQAVRPRAILAVGTFAAQLLAGSDRPLGKLRGEVYSYEEIPLVVTYHPAALLRNSGWTRPTWEDLQLLRSVLDA